MLQYVAVCCSKVLQQSAASPAHYTAFYAQQSRTFHPRAITHTHRHRHTTDTGTDKDKDTDTDKDKDTDTDTDTDTDKDTHDMAKT